MDEKTFESLYNMLYSTCRFDDGQECLIFRGASEGMYAWIDQLADQCAASWKKNEAEGRLADALKAKNDAWLLSSYFIMPRHLDHLRREWHTGTAEQFVRSTTYDYLNEKAEEYLTNAFRNYRPESGRLSHYLSSFAPKYLSRSFACAGNLPVELTEEITPAQTPEAHDVEHLREIQLLSRLRAIMDFEESITRSSDSRRKDTLDWYRVFYTEDITSFTKALGIDRCQDELRILAARLQDYEDFYMSSSCRSLEDIMNTPLKPLGETSYCDPAKAASVPEFQYALQKFPSGISLRYKGIQQSREDAVRKKGESARSNQLAGYRRLLKAWGIYIDEPVLTYDEEG